MKKFFTDPVREWCYHLYFLVAALSGCAYGSFLNVYLGHLGFGVMIIGLFSTIPSLLGMVLQPLLAAWADKARSKRGSMLIMVAVSTISIGLIWVLRPQNGATNLSAAVLLGVQTLYLAFSGAGTALNTAVLMEHLAEHKASERYGRIRVSWTVGYAIAGAWVGVLNEADPAAFILYAVITSVISMGLIWLLPWKRTAAKEEKKEPFAWKSLLGYTELWWLTFIVFLIGLANTFTYTFLPTFFMTLPGADNEVFGWCISLRTVTEIPVLFAMGWILKRLGIKKTLMLPAFSTILRWLLVALWPNPTMILATQLLHGLGYVVYSVAMTRYVADTLPSEIGSSAQTMISLLTMTLPNLAGGVLGGFIIETLGMGYIGCLWCIVALSVAASALLVWITVKEKKSAVRTEN